MDIVNSVLLPTLGVIAVLFVLSRRRSQQRERSRDEKFQKINEKVAVVQGYKDARGAVRNWLVTHPDAGLTHGLMPKEFRALLGEYLGADAVCRRLSPDDVLAWDEEIADFWKIWKATACDQLAGHAPSSQLFLS